MTSNTAGGASTASTASTLTHHCTSAALFAVDAPVDAPRQLRQPAHPLRQPSTPASTAKTAFDLRRSHKVDAVDAGYTGTAEVVRRSR